jgi:hypothetical protein
LHLENLGIQILSFIFLLVGGEIPEEISEWCANNADCAAVDTKCLIAELQCNARCVFFAQNPTYAEVLLAERCCRGKSLILFQAFDELGAGARVTSSWSARDSPPISTKEKRKQLHQKKVPYDTSGNKSMSRDKSKDYGSRASTS